MPQEGRAARQDVASPVLSRSADGAMVIGGGVSAGGIWEFPPVGKLLVPEPAPSGPVHLHFEGPGDCGGGPEVVADLWENLGEGLEPDSGIGACEVF